jgi:hypothetical protein
MQMPNSPLLPLGGIEQLTTITRRQNQNKTCRVKV